MPLRNIILRLRELAPEAAILPVVLNIKEPRSIGAHTCDGAAIATSEHRSAGGTSLLMYGGMAQPSLLALGFIGGVGSFIGQWPTGPPNINATPPPCNRAGLSRAGLWGPELLHSLSGIRHRVSSELTRTSCPGSGYARSSGIVLTDTRARNRRCEGQCIGIVAGVYSFQTSNFLLRTSAQRLIPAARASPSRAGTRSLWLARSDHPRLR